MKYLFTYVLVLFSFFSTGCGKGSLKLNSSKNSSSSNVSPSQIEPVQIEPVKIEPTPSGSPSPSSSPSAAPSITLVRLEPLMSLGSPAPVKLVSTGGVITLLKLNGIAVLPDIALQVPPVSAGSPVYTFDIQASGPGGEFRNIVSFSIPTCTLAISNSVTDSDVIPAIINASAILNYSVGATSFSINGGTPEPLNRSIAGSLTKNLTFPYQGNALTVAASVLGVDGDITQCQTSFVATKPIDPGFTASGSSSYYYLAGFRAPQDNTTALMGAGAGATTGYYTQFTGRFSLPLINGSTASRSGSCAANEVVVGFSPALVPTIMSLRPVCQGIHQSFTLVGSQTQSAPWAYGASLNCGAGRVMTGSNYNESNNSFSITCSTVKWMGN